MTAAGTVWGLDTGRPGEFMQVETLGQALGLVFERIRLSPEGVPLAVLPALPPLVIVSFGRAAQAALRLAISFNPRPVLVHLGTPGQTPITAFDLVIPMPQDDYPAAPNVLFLRLPLNGAPLAPDPPPLETRHGCTIIVGGPSRHFRMPRQAIGQLIRFGIRLALVNGEALRVVTSPRTPAAVVTQLRRLNIDGSFTLNIYGEAVYGETVNGNASFADLLQAGGRFVVTSDSASMLAEACRTGAPVWLFPLPRRLNLSTFFQHAADRCFGRQFRHRLVRRGWVGGGTDFQRWHRSLESHSYIRAAAPATDAALRWAPAGMPADTDLRDCRVRILALVANTGMQRRPKDAGTDQDN